MCLNDAILAIAAFTQQAKSHHAVQLNFGCLCARALANSLALPRLYKGNDSVQTDVASALA